MWIIVDCIKIIQEIIKETMWTKNIFILLAMLLVHSALAGKKPSNIGVASFDCPLDDDPDDPTVLPVQGDCTKFLKCSYGKAYTLSCPRGLHWAASQNRCEAPKIANCDPTATTPRPVIGQGCDFDYKPHPNDCDKAIVCASGRESIVYCMEGTYWNSNLKKCDFDDSVCD